jgi:hypothetical protein
MRFQHGEHANSTAPACACKIISFVMSEIADSSRLADHEGAALERRLLRGMFVAVAVAVVFSLPLAPWRVTTGLLLGGVLSFFNHHWLRTSLAAVFDTAAQQGKRPRLKAARYVLRYFIVAATIAAAYMLDLVSVVATIAGLCSFAASIMIEAMTQLYFAIRYREEN